ncbi:NAD(P)H-dependent oxidoreductase [Clostridium estertheticum]|uniref:NAD(P)H-dependent oxidoreductase n=1 Tax=Clostridium estertheticum TaxID=238834 RepID=A0AA47EN86_9CLOT|nr:NAD(P)H-dependent oxidoreductase [Clostridium estertheticum]MBU3157357.1 NAD(P)H-dependent oxidoreductase [Clostridium estertheticum]WAG62464.1 NAD(P)H-dependent oxidoreductase [Clostridium estertheticum]
MKNICFINGSPKGKGSNSLLFLNRLDEDMNENNYNRFYIHVTSSIHSGKIEEDFKTMSHADVIVFAFPLYVFSLPGVLMRFLEDYYIYLKNNNKSPENVRVYAIVNCGFPEPTINDEAIRVLKNFCVRLNLNWRFAVSIGMGEVVGSTKDIKFMQRLCSKIYSSLYEINKDIENNIETLVENKYVAPNFPIFLFGEIGKLNWINTAKKNGLSKNDLYKKPYMT